jgi:hypothetical protein
MKLRNHLETQINVIFVGSDASRDRAVIAPGVYADVAPSVEPFIRTDWTLYARCETRGKRYDVSLSFEPFDGRLLMFERSPE